MGQCCRTSQEKRQDLYSSLSPVLYLRTNTQWPVFGHPVRKWHNAYKHILNYLILIILLFNEIWKMYRLIKIIEIQIDSFGRYLRYTNQYQQQRCATERIYFSLDAALHRCRRRHSRTSHSVERIKCLASKKVFGRWSFGWNSSASRWVPSIRK